MVGSAPAVSSMRASEPGASRVSGLTSSSHGAAVAAAPMSMARLRPRLAGFSSTLTPSRRAISALASREALSTTTTSSSWGPAAAGSEPRHAARSSALS
jgi:hypothetical protein